MLQVEFFFDFSCPWSYLACTRVREVAMRTGAGIVWRPFALAGLDPRLAERAGRLDSDPARAAWQLQDLADWAHYCDLPLNIPADWPRAAPKALGSALVAIDKGKAPAFITRTFAAAFGDGLDIDDEDVLSGIAQACDLASDEFLTALAAASIQSGLEANLAELQSRGGFRSATLFVGEQMFCGNSRMPLVEFALAQASDREFVMPGQHG